MYVNEQMTTREKKKKKSFKWIKSLNDVHIYTLNLKHRSQNKKKKEEKRLSASRVGHKGLEKKKRINTCFNKQKVKGAKWLMVYALIFK
jgi:hypothetical protein